MKRGVVASILTLVFVPAASAHDLWIEASARAVRVGAWLSLSVMLGNHGNEHRDFKLAGKVAAADRRLFVVGPDGRRQDLSPSLFDVGMTPDEGYWTTRFHPTTPGLYIAGSSFDKVMSYAPVRDVKCAKAFFVAGASLDHPPAASGFDQALGAPFELIPLTDPTALAPGKPLRVRLIYRGHPMAGVKVGFVPRGAAAEGETDPHYQATTGPDGTAQMILRESNAYLVAAHWTDEKAKGKGYGSINYSATLYVLT